MPKITNVEEKIVFATSAGTGDGIPLVILGIPGGAWEYLQSGKTQELDLTKVGLPIKLMLFAEKDHAAVMNLLEAGMVARGEAYENRMRDDFRINPDKD